MGAKTSKIQQPEYQGVPQNIASSNTQVNPSVSQPSVVNSGIQRRDAQMIDVEDPDGLQFTITRHAHSCNNLKEGKSDSNTQFLKTYIPLVGKKIQGAVKNYNFFDRTSEHDPGLSFYGVLATLLKTSRISGRYNSDTVFVSCLVRTWMTAILLYLPNITNDTLTLVISPFIKEKHKELGTIAKQMVVAALTRMRYTEKNPDTIRDSNNGGYTTIDGGNLPKDIGEQIIMLIHFFKNLSVFYQHLKNKEKKQVHIDIYKLLEKFVGKKIKLVIPIGTVNHKIIIPLSENISVNLDELLSSNTGIFQNTTIGQFYFFYTTLYPGFPRNSPSMTIGSVLQTYKSTVDGMLEPSQTSNNKRYQYFERNIAEYFEDIISKEFVSPTKFMGGNGSVLDSAVELDDEDEDEDEGDKQIVEQSSTPEKEQFIVTTGKQIVDPSSTPEKEQSIVTTGVDEDTKNFLTKDINQFLGWVKDYSTKNQNIGTNIHAVTHSDCMQTFCSQFEAKKPDKNFVEEDKLFQSGNILIKKEFPKKLPKKESFNCNYRDKCTEEDILIKNKKSNKKNFNLKEQNSWDLTFQANISDSGTVLTNIKAYKGVLKPNIGNLRSACERNCNYGYGVGVLVDENRTNECSKKLTKNTAPVSAPAPTQVPEQPAQVQASVLPVQAPDPPVQAPASASTYSNISIPDKDSNNDYADSTALQTNAEDALHDHNYGFQPPTEPSKTKKLYQFWKGGNKTRKQSKFNKKTKKQRKGKRYSKKINKKYNKKNIN